MNTGDDGHLVGGTAGDLQEGKSEGADEDKRRHPDEAFDAEQGVAARLPSSACGATKSRRGESRARYQPTAPTRARSCSGSGPRCRPSGWSRGAVLTAPWPTAFPLPSWPRWVSYPRSESTLLKDWPVRPLFVAPRTDLQRSEESTLPHPREAAGGEPRSSARREKFRPSLRRAMHPARRRSDFLAMPHDGATNLRSYPGRHRHPRMLRSCLQTTIEGSPDYGPSSS